MKKLNFCILVLLISVSIHAKAVNTGLFQIDENQIMSEMSGLTLLEDYVTQNQGVTLSEMQASGHILSYGISDQPSPFNDEMTFEAPLGIPSFIWGFCLGLPGVAVVYFVSEDKDETKKAVFGCIASTVAYSACYLVYYIVYIASAIQ
ncbi:MAG: hypothetical protein GX437_04760 [Sphingobacteriales bacterium]|nr:hypothetical protein [Sphingobacteriales bacterium]